MKVMLVEWDDTCSGTSWESRGGEEHKVGIVSIGILAREDDKEVELIPNQSISHKLHQIAIPKACIKRMRKLRL
jgi:hypothetical protein